MAKNKLHNDTNNNINFHINRVIASLNKMQITKDLNIDHNLLEQILDLDNPSDVFQHINNNSALNSEEKADILFSAFIEKQNLSFLNETFNFSAKYGFTVWVVSSLMHNDYQNSHKIKTKLQKMGAWNSKQVNELFNNIELHHDDINLFADLEVVQKKINQLHQNNKLENESAKNNIEEQGWFNKSGSIKVNYSDAIEIGRYSNDKYTEGKCYAYLPKKFSLQKWISALDKAVADKSEGQNGIKYLAHQKTSCNNVIELKINGGARLYTTKLHMNDNGDFLAVLNSETNHKGIGRLVRNTKSLSVLDDCHAIQILDDFTINHYDLEADAQIELCGEVC